MSRWKKTASSSQRRKPAASSRSRQEGARSATRSSRRTRREPVRWLRDFLRAFAAEGKTVFVSSHVLAEVAQTVDRVVNIDKGRLLAESSLAELTARLGASVRVRSPQAAELRERLAGAGIESHGIDSTLLVRGTTPERVGEIAAASQIVLHELVAESSSLEEVFLELTHGEKS